MMTVAALIKKLQGFINHQDSPVYIETDDQYGGGFAYKIEVFIDEEGEIGLRANAE